jgi:chromatin segregation and condensation protein Rec8/ScpA/Scc1 (kleisin family)
MAVSGLANVVDDATEELTDRLQERLDKLEELKNNFRLLKDLTDTELGLYIKNWYFGIHKRDATWPPTNFSEFPEFKEDVVMQRLATLYNTLNIHKGKLPFREKYEPLKRKIEKATLSLSTLATDMANRSMKEDVYTALLENTHEALKNANMIIRFTEHTYIKRY